MFAFRKYTVNSILLTTVMVYKVMANTESVSAELLLRGGKVGLGSCAIVLCRFVCQHPGERSHQYEKHAFPHKPFLVDHSHVFVKPPAAFRSAGLTLPRKVMASSMLSRSTYGWKDNCRASPCKFVLHLLKKKSVKHFHHSPLLWDTGFSPGRMQSPLSWPLLLSSPPAPQHESLSGQKDTFKMSGRASLTSLRISQWIPISLT